MLICDHLKIIIYTSLFPAKVPRPPLKVSLNTQNATPSLYMKSRRTRQSRSLHWSELSFLNCPSAVALFFHLMETFRARTFSGSGDDVYEIENGTERSGRTVLNEHISRFNGLDSDTLDNRSPKSADQDSDEHSIHKKNPKDYSYLYTYLSTTLFVIVLIVENIFQFRLFIDSNASISFYWLESCVIALFFRFWGRRRIRRLV